MPPLVAPAVEQLSATRPTVRTVEQVSSFAVTAERLVIVAHPNADALELAQVRGYRAVVAKGRWRTGDHAVYIPEQAVLPAGLVDELGLTGRLAGPDANRVKAIRLRGELSQGIVCLPAALAGVDLAAAAEDRTDFAERLGITKWVPPIPTHLSGMLEPAPDLITWIDVEDRKRYPDVFAPGEPVVATEKVHGTAALFTFHAAEGRLQVSSKGYGRGHKALVEDPANLYWRAAHAHGVATAAQQVAARFGAERVGVFGEVYGAGVQDLTYGADVRRGAPGLAVFDVVVDVAGDRRWLDPDEVADVCAATGLPAVPVLYTGGYDTELLAALAEGTETVSGAGAHLREGVVVRAATDRYSPVLGGRAIVKFVSGAYLLRKGGTEFE